MSTIPFSPKQKPDESTLTDRQRKVLDAIRTHIDEQGFAPSFREIGNAAGLKSPSSVKHQLQVLEDKGFIRMNANKGRAIEVVAGSAPNAEKPSQASEEATSTSNVAEIYQFPAEAIAESHDVPLVGRIAAGVPITAEQHVDDVMRLPERLTGSGTCSCWKSTAIPWWMPLSAMATMWWCANRIPPSTEISSPLCWTTRPR